MGKHPMIKKIQKTINPVFFLISEPSFGSCSDLSNFCDPDIDLTTARTSP
jgi:hypothetical protein